MAQDGIWQIRVPHPTSPIFGDRSPTDRRKADWLATGGHSVRSSKSCFHGLRTQNSTLSRAELVVPGIVLEAFSLFRMQWGWPRSLCRQKCAFTQSWAAEAPWKGIEYFGIFSRSAQPVHLQHPGLLLLSPQASPLPFASTTQLHVLLESPIRAHLCPLYPSAATLGKRLLSCSTPGEEATNASLRG